MTLKKSEQIEFDNKVIPFYNIVDKKYFCKKCNLRIGSRLIQHYERCIGLGTGRSPIDIEKNQNLFSQFCNMGCGQKSKFYYRNGNAYCCKFGANCPVKVQKDSVKKIGINPFEGKVHPRGMLGKDGWSKGLTKETSQSIVKQAESYKKFTAIHGGMHKNRKHTDEMKEILRQLMHARYASGWQSTSCGRAKSYSHSSPIAGDMKVTGTWELAFAQILDKVGIKWSKNKKRFPYIKPDGKKATYLPDFYIDELDLYCEVKGYETDIDREKFKQFPEKLVVIRKSEMKQIKKWLADPLAIVIKEDVIKLIKK